MSKKELTKELMERMQNFGYFPSFTNVKIFIQEYKKLAKPEPQAGHAEEAPRYVRNVIARLRELPLHDRDVWLKAIMDEFEEDFSHSIWREGYEQGKFEASMIPCNEPQKPVIPQFVADWIKYCKFTHVDLQYALIVDNVYFYNYANQKDFSKLKEFLETENNQATFARAWLDGYEVEKEKRYEVILCNGQSLKTVYRQGEDRLDFEKVYGDLERFTRKQLEDAGFDWVFDCPGIEVEEVE